MIAAPEAGGWGHSEAWLFRTDEDVEPDRVPALLPTLPMGCVEGLGATGRFEIARRPADAIWSLLFAAASLGSAYHHGAHGAFGRLWAWKSMAALGGAPADASAEEVEHHVRRTTWFESDAEWFCNDASTDYGIAALSPRPPPDHRARGDRHRLRRRTTRRARRPPPRCRSPVP
ncbi:DUF6183 family protein [Streptomyces sp. NPDC088180]|uniref:DUF6183 family protein n=1 Tax=Streptomyces sp. NPDC088180 TaxID=3365837 RepID=UPI0038279D23